MRRVDIGFLFLTFLLAIPALARAESSMNMVQFGISGRVSAELYNVADALPKKYWQKFDGFYTNPPFGQSNKGKSVEVFLRRGIEAVGKESVGYLVIADYKALSWTTEVLFCTEKIILKNGFVINEILPEFHHYHTNKC